MALWKIFGSNDAQASNSGDPELTPAVTGLGVVAPALQHQQQQRVASASVSSSQPSQPSQPDPRNSAASCGQGEAEEEDIVAKAFENVRAPFPEQETATTTTTNSFLFPNVHDNTERGSAKTAQPSPVATNPFVAPIPVPSDTRQAPPSPKPTPPIQPVNPFLSPIAHPPLPVPVVTHPNLPAAATQQQQTINTPLAAAASLLFARSDYEDPITYLIMSDPVTCSDGHTYERSVIERCFEDRIQAEEARQQRQQQQQQRNGAAVEEDTTACCGSQGQEPIELLSPISNQVVTGTLVPNFTLEQQIVRLMEANAFGLDANEIRDWKERRCQKKERDAHRREEERQERERQAEQRRNALEAQARRDAEENANPSRQVRFDPTHSNSNSSGSGSCETGLVVRLAEPLLLLHGSSPPPQRCAVNRCVVRLDSASGQRKRCPRCTRHVCEDCLAFCVADWQNPNNRHDICVDCATQLVEATDGLANANIQARREVISRDLERHLMRFSNHASLLHERIVRHEANQRHGPRLVELEYKIGRLEDQHRELQNQAAEAEARTAAAQSDSSPGNDDELAALMGRKQTLAAAIEKLAADCDSLEKELVQCAQDQPQKEDDEAAVVRYVENMSALTHRLEERKLEMALEMSNLEALDAVIASTESEKSDEVLALEAECDRLAQEYERLSRSVVECCGDDFMKHALELSAVSNQLEETQVLLVTAKSLARQSKTKSNTHVSLPNTARFVFAAQASPPTASSRRKKRFLFGKKKRGTTRDTQSWLSKLTQTKHALFSSPSLDTRIEKARDLLELLDDQVCEVVSNESPSDIGLESARVELTQYLASNEKNEGSHHRKLNTDTSDIFSDAVTDLLSETDDGVTQSHSDEFGGSEPDSVALSMSMEQMLEDLNAIGVSETAWELPLGLGYPTSRMTRDVSILRNTAEIRKIEFEQNIDEEWSSRFQKLETQLEELEEAVKRARSLVADAEANAEEEEARQKKRVEERRQREAARLERERVLREKAAEAERERAELLRKHREAEAATRTAFSNAAGANNNGAETFGGVGDLRMCKRCKAGPIENIACSDLKAHNDRSGYYKGDPVHNGVNSRKPNHCPHCNWFNPNWKAWPYWDGVYGPH